MQLLHQPTFVPTNLHTKQLLLQQPLHQTAFTPTTFTPNSFYSNSQPLLPLTFTPDTSYARQLLHQTTFTPETFYASTSYTKTKPIHQTAFAPTRFYITEPFHLPDFTPTPARQRPGDSNRIRRDTLEAGTQTDSGDTDNRRRAQVLPLPCKSNRDSNRNTPVHESRDTVPQLPLPLCGCCPCQANQPPRQQPEHAATCMPEDESPPATRTTDRHANTAPRPQSEQAATRRNTSPCHTNLPPRQQSEHVRTREPAGHTDNEVPKCCPCQASLAPRQQPQRAGTREPAGDTQTTAKQIYSPETATGTRRDTPELTDSRQEGLFILKGGLFMKPGKFEYDTFASSSSSS